MAIYIVAGCALIISAIVFYKTVITREWRNEVPNEDDCWYWLVFYYNPQDKRLFVPKRTGLGWTLNFGRPLSVVIFLLFLIGLVALIKSTPGK